jgi:hypothetical protein
MYKDAINLLVTPMCLDLIDDTTNTNKEVQQQQAD